MKVGILTFHRSVNEGSVAQAVCGVKLIEELIRSIHGATAVVDVRLIDYRPWGREALEYLVWLKKTWPFVDPGQVRKTASVRRWMAEQVGVSEKNSYSTSTQKARAFVESLQLDLIVVGSDTVWASKRGLAFPNIYFLPGVRGARRLALAVSVDRTDWRKLQSGTVQRALESSMAQFDRLFVRDQATMSFLQRMAPKLACEHLPDPTILYGMERFESRMPQHWADSLSRLIGVAIGDARLRARVVEKLQADGCIPLNLLGRPLSRIDNRYVGLPFEEKLGTYRHILRGLVTDRFHATIFGLSLGNYPVAMVKRHAGTDDQRGKGEDLLCRLGLEHWVVDFENVAAGLERTMEVLHMLRPATLEQGLQDYRQEGRRKLAAALEHVLTVLPQAKPSADHERVRV